MATSTRPLPDDAIFRGDLGKMVLDMDPFTEGDPAGVMLSLMAGFSAYIGERPRIHSMSGPMPLSIWPVLVGISGVGRKGTATGAAMRIFKTAFADFYETHMVPEIGGTGLGFMANFDDHRDEEGRFGPWFGVEEEMGQFIGATKDRRLSTAICKAWDGSGIRYRTGKDHYHIPNPHVGIIGHVQPKIWVSIVGGKVAASGVYNRFVVAYVQRSKVLPIIPTAAMIAGRDAVARKWGPILRRAGVFAREVEIVRVSEKVGRVFEKKHRPACDALTGTNEELSELAERSMAYMLRIAALYALADMRDYVEEGDFDAALAWVTYSVQSTIYVMSRNRTFSGKSALAEKVLRILGEHGPQTFTLLHSRCGRANTRENIEGALMELADEVIKYIPPRIPGKAGRPGEYVCLKADLPNLEGITIVPIGEDPPEGVDEEVYDVGDELPDERPTIKATAERVSEERIPTQEPQGSPEKPAERLALAAAPVTPKATRKRPRPARKPVETPTAKESGLPDGWL